MKKTTLIFIILMICFTQSSCRQQSGNKNRLPEENKTAAKKQLLTGAEQYKQYLNIAYESIQLLENIRKNLED